MAVAIRLRREGTRNRAFYRIVVADSRSRRDGRFIEMIGIYNPLDKGTNFQLDLAKAEDWLAKGAQPSDTVRSLIKKARRNVPAEQAEPEPEAEAEAEAVASEASEESSG